MRALLLLVSLLLGGIIHASPQEDSRFRLLPQPQSLELLPGKGLHYHDLTHILPADNSPVPILGNLLDRLPRALQNGKGLTLRLTTQGVPESPEGYLLEVKGTGVTLSARNEAGLFYGCQTLEQLMEDSRDGNLPIPALRITDYPTIAYRAVHFDTKHHLSRMDYYYAQIDRLARYKINAVIWEVEDKLRYTRRPEAAASNAISKQEMQALCRYAKERNIEISPLVQGLGHAGFILKHHWELRENPDSDWEFCPSDPRTYEVQFDLYKDAIEAMPHGKYLHVGGDEITAIGIDERCKATGKTAFELQMIWLKQVCDFAVAHGRTPIFWDDMPLKYGKLWELIRSDATEQEVTTKWDSELLDKAIEQFPKECVYMRWNYGDATLPAHQRLLKWYHDKGLKVMGATAASAGDSPVLPREDTKAGYIRGFSQLVAQNQLEGILATAWDDGSPHSETVWRGYIAQGEYGWNPTARTVEAFKQAHAWREYGFRPVDNRLRFLDELEQALFFYDGALVSSGRRNPAWGVTAFTLINLPDKGNPGAWSKTYQDKLMQAKAEAIRYEVIDKEVKTAIQQARRGRYTLRIYEQINHLQFYPSRLLLALEEYDKAATDTDRHAALRQLSEVCDSFAAMRSAVEAVYSQTRFMQTPDGYVADMNHHNHLSARSNNSDWMYYYELPMVRKIKQWITHQ